MCAQTPARSRSPCIPLCSANPLGFHKGHGFFKATSPQVLCCAPCLELLLGPTPLLSHAAASQPSKTLARFAVSTLHMAVFVVRLKLPGILPSHQMNAERGWEEKGRRGLQGSSFRASTAAFGTEQGRTGVCTSPRELPSLWESRF